MQNCVCLCLSFLLELLSFVPLFAGWQIGGGANNLPKVATEGSFLKNESASAAKLIFFPQL